MTVSILLRYRVVCVFVCLWFGLTCVAVSADSRGAEAVTSGPTTTAPASKDTRARYEQGLEEFKSRKWDEAMACFQETSRCAKGYLKLCSINMEGQLHRIENRLPEAIAAFERVVDEAEGLMSSSSSREPVRRRAALLKRLALIWQAEICEQQRDWEEAIKRYEYFLAAYAPQDSATPHRIALPSPELYERLAMLYWKQSDWEHARRTLERLLSHWPEWERAPHIAVSILALDAAPREVREKRLAFLASMLTWPLLSDADEAAPLTATLPGMERLPDPTGPIRSRLRSLMAQVPENSRFRPVLAMHLGWMLFEAGRPDAAQTHFSQAARMTSDEQNAFSKRLHGYARLSCALAMSRQGELSDAIEIVEGVIQEVGDGHLARVAAGVAGSFQKKVGYRKAAKKCGVKGLD